MTNTESRLRELRRAAVIAAFPELSDNQLLAIENEVRGLEGQNLEVDPLDIRESMTGQPIIETEH